MKNRTDMRRCVATLLLLLPALLARAQGGAVDITPPSPAKALACLKQPADPISFPEQYKLDHAWGMIRVKLLFTKPDAKPSVEVLANTAREDMQDEVFRRVADYRLPCLTPEDGVVSAVQEFNFNNSDREPLPLEGEDRPPMCIVMPREDMASFDSMARNIEHVMLAIAFDGDAEQPPKVKVIYSTGDSRLERAATRYAAKYRMPCRHAGDAPRVARQQFTFRPAGTRIYAFKREGFSLAEFLSMTEGIHDVRAHFDSQTMHCPFKVDYEILGPHLPNEVRTGGKPDPNRVAFLKWLAERQLDFKKNEAMAAGVFGAVLQINVPCGVLNLEPKSAAAPAASSPAGG